MSVILPDAQKVRATVWRTAGITFLRAAFHGLRVPLLVAATLPGCASARPPVLKPQAAVAPVGPAYATVAAVRPIRPLAPAGGDTQAAILAAMSVSPAVAAAGGSSSEIVVRTDGGETLSVVQPNSADLTPGERVIIVPAGLPRLVPASPQS
jgi:TOBE domain